MYIVGSRVAFHNSNIIFSPASDVGYEDIVSLLGSQPQYPIHFNICTNLFDDGVSY